MRLIDITHLTTGYNHYPVISDFNMTVERGEFVGIAGPNGGGKTTLVKSLVGLIQPYSGRIVYYNRNGNPTPYLSIGYLPQRKDIDNLFPISVEEVILSGLSSEMNWMLQPSAQQKRSVHITLETVGLTAQRKKAIGTLSGGQIQRALLGRAIIKQPELLVLDEPNSFLDSQFEAQLHNILQSLNSKGVTILMVSHEMESLKRLASRIVAIEG